MLKMFKQLSKQILAQKLGQSNKRNGAAGGRSARWARVTHPVTSGSVELIWVGI